MVTRLLRDDDDDPDPAVQYSGVTPEYLDLLMVERDALIALVRAREKILLKYGRIRRPTMPPRIQR